MVPGPRGRPITVTIALLLLAVPALEGATVRPAIFGGYAHIVDPHAAFVGALRVQLLSRFFVQAEYVALRGGDHWDYGPAFQIGLSSARTTGLRPYLAVGGGPVKGLAGDDGLGYLATGASYPLGNGWFVQPEFRTGILGESAYWQIALGVGFGK
jgi:hypothetical protein